MILGSSDPTALRLVAEVLAPETTTIKAEMSERIRQLQNPQNKEEELVSAVVLAYLDAKYVLLTLDEWCQQRERIGNKVTVNFLVGEAEIVYFRLFEDVRRLVCAQGVPWDAILPNPESERPLWDAMQSLRCRIGTERDREVVSRSAEVLKLKEEAAICISIANQYRAFNKPNALFYERRYSKLQVEIEAKKAEIRLIAQGESKDSS